MSAVFQGIKQQGDSASDGATATWTIAGIQGAPNGPDFSGVAPTIPGQLSVDNAAFNASYGWNLDIQSVRKTYGFGPIKKMRVQIGKLRSWFDENGHYFKSGRVWIYIPSTGEVFCVSSQNPLMFSAFTAAPSDNPEEFNLEYNLNVPPDTVIQVWAESDISTGAFVSSPRTSITVTLFNR